MGQWRGSKEIWVSGEEVKRWKSREREEREEREE